MDAKTHTIKLKYFNDYLKFQGYSLVGNSFWGARIVNFAKYNDIRVIIKRDKRDGTQDLVENEILEKFKGLDRIPQKLLFEQDLLSKGILNSKKPVSFFKKFLIEYHISLENRFLVESFIPGKEYNYESLSTTEEQKLIDLVSTFHKAGYARLDLGKADNFILNSKGELYLVDLGQFIKKDDPQFNLEKDYDLYYLDEMLGKSRGKK